MSRQSDGDEFTPSDKIIAIMGPPGAGKSTFIAKASETDEEGVYHDLQNPQRSVRIVRAKAKIDGHPMVFLDVPGFEDGAWSDIQILEQIANCLVEHYKQNIKLAGIVYMHPITKNRMDRTQVGSLRLFKSICGDSMSGVTIVSSMWGNVNADTGAKREQELVDDYWKEYMTNGCRTKRFHNTRDSAIDIVNDMVQHSPGINLQGLRNELAD
ncbi:hypothetical protein FIBSPDRAFT_851874 [Athelia psychrophila]|uniref:G domain-containing protein n=1 Tax=Athelia psychrophila TaxID=1759441 RepID=A0A166S5S0_9AGAM|nr:hypothetical protein FIBSPDRAFT_851874 [Fibularhizoctonia sp. CBS 109695]